MIDLKYLEDIFDPDTAVAVQALKALKLLLRSYYYPTLGDRRGEKENINDASQVAHNQNHESTSKHEQKLTDLVGFVRPLLIQLLNVILPKFPLIIYRIDGMDIYVAAELYEVPVLMFKYLFDINQDYGGVLKFEDCPDPVDYHTFAIDFANELANKLLCGTSIGYIHMLLDPITQLIQINDDEQSKPTKLQLEATDLVYKVISHSIRILDDVATTDNISQIRDDQNLDFCYDLMLFEDVLVKLTDLVPFVFDNDSKCDIVSRIIQKLKHVQNNNTRMFVMLVGLKLDCIFKKFTQFEQLITVDKSIGVDNKATEQAFDYSSELENIKRGYQIKNLEAFNSFKHKETVIASIYAFCERNYKIIELQGFPKFDSKTVQKLYSEFLVQIVSSFE